MKFDKVMSSLPYFCRGVVVKGFGRGSKELGIPTANFPESVVESLPDDISTGIYYGWAQVNNGEVYKMVMSVGWNPYYQNKKKSMETHIINDFKEDFYGETLNVIMLGFIRGEKDFASIDNLIKEIHNDINVAKKELESPVMLSFKKDRFFTQSMEITSNGETSTGSNL